MREYVKSSKSWTEPYDEESDALYHDDRIKRDRRSSAALLSLLRQYHKLEDVLANTVREKLGRLWNAKDAQERL